MIVLAASASGDGIHHRQANINHNGDIARALTMIDVAAKSGADAVKFQFPDR